MHARRKALKQVTNVMFNRILLESRTIEGNSPVCEKHSTC